jgi:hypothetical protein
VLLANLLDLASVKIMAHHLAVVLCDAEAQEVVAAAVAAHLTAVAVVAVVAVADFVVAINNKREHSKL